MSIASLNLNPAIAKPSSNGQIQCIVCNTLVKPKIWTAHLNGKKHRESCEKLKQQLASSTKRPIENSTQNGTGAPPVKKARESSVPSTNGPLPSDFFDEEPTLSIQTPWQKSKDDENAHIRERKGIIEGVPQGFFDDKRRDGMVRETIVNEAHMNEEYDRLMRELNEKNVEEEAQADEEDERDARLRDIANADEQMEKWMRLNAMEKLKESRLQEAREKAAAEEEEDEGSDDEAADFGNWRTKRFL
ncbi:unnamed protein product [Nippostrongylus brasiliensis]|uniref:Zinc finger protein 830 n=1 Tax=Nippostrongylus brasiliensis TaxID=27835 RepID=A0A0N4Y1I2_NIPBR|nr:hypothetical protein Q1695_015012 [Nippostrongylus brasiliensis]VDL73071.1 unnamed protein product [Nippostrongylus brasiliensis]